MRGCVNSWSRALRATWAEVWVGSIGALGTVGGPSRLTCGARHCRLGFCRLLRREAFSTPREAPAVGALVDRPHAVELHDLSKAVHQHQRRQPDVRHPVFCHQLGKGRCAAGRRGYGGGGGRGGAQAQRGRPGQLPRPQRRRPQAKQPTASLPGMPRPRRHRPGRSAPQRPRPSAGIARTRSPGRRTWPASS